ncbi:MAG: hypothetical protein ABI333_16040 [bacterium]
MIRLRCWVVVFCLLGIGCGGPVPRRTTFDRRSPVQFAQRISIPDEAVIYMQNLALMRSRVQIGQVKHIELALPPRIIAESLQLRIGPKQIREFNVMRAHTSKLGMYSRVRIRNIDRYLKPGEPLVVEYLTWGVHWSAQYRVDVLPEGQLRLQLGAMIQNHWYDLSSMKVTLVAGWVGVTPVSPGRARAGRAGARVAHLGRGLPAEAIPPAFRRRRGAAKRGHSLAWSSNVQSSQVRYRRTRAFAGELVSKYKIRRVDNTLRLKASNFQMQFSEYYQQIQGARQSGRAFYNRVDGYSLYRDLKLNLNRQHKSYLHMASLVVNASPYYLWPADRGDSVYTVYKVVNGSKILLPAGTAWIYRDGVFVGHDVHHWTPVGGHTFLTTTNDGGVAVQKSVTFLQDDTRRIRLTVRSLAGKPVQVEIFERNPLWSEKGRLTFSHEPLTANEKGQFHRWKLQIQPRGSMVVQLDFRPAPKKRAQPVVQPTLRRAPAPAPRRFRRAPAPASRRFRRR